jgi:hypothetical protein
MPFDLTTVLGRSVRDPEATQLIEYFEENPRSPGRAEAEDSYFVPFKQSGFCLGITAAGVIYDVRIYAQARGYYQACTDGLPFGLTYQSTRAEARKLFGSPACEDGPIEEIFPPHDVIYWDRWDYVNFSVHVTYSEHCDSVLRIILESIPTPASNES